MERVYYTNPQATCQVFYWEELREELRRFQFALALWKTLRAVKRL
jgi:hypothetical protein